MGIDKTQSAIEILKYFYDNHSRRDGITVSELRKNVMPRTKGRERDVWLRSKLGLVLVKGVVDIFLTAEFIKRDELIVIKDKKFNSYMITEKGVEVTNELKKTKYLKELFASILYREVMKPK